MKFAIVATTLLAFVGAVAASPLDADEEGHVTRSLVQQYEQYLDARAGGCIARNPSSPVFDYGKHNIAKAASMSSTSLQHRHPHSGYASHKILIGHNRNCNISNTAVQGSPKNTIFNIPNTAAYHQFAQRSRASSTACFPLTSKPAFQDGGISHTLTRCRQPTIAIHRISTRMPSSSPSLKYE
ncbi:hypothetical protein BKA70DRAFT_1221779 [Coprinopsis sp. MPI-PUGE-AT-0042]|nr:hypothetical protein BKA70DRAFT_1221779 [Coprinopsis sp. MPI-PUGE-AT-0042]